VLKFILIILLNFVFVKPIQAEQVRDPFAIRCSVLSCSMLKHYPLSQLQFVGTLSQGNPPIYLALIKTPNSKMYSITTNMPIGIEGGIVVKITLQTIVVKNHQSDVINLTLIKRDPHENSQISSRISHDSFHS